MNRNRDRNNDHCHNAHRALEPGERALEHDETRARNLGGAFEIHEAERLAEALVLRLLLLEGLLELVRPAIEHLEACKKEATANAELLDAFLCGARRMELIGQRMLDRLEVAALYLVPPAG